MASEKSDGVGRDAMCEISSRSAEEIFQIGMHLLQRNRPEDASVAFKRAMRLAPTEPRYVSFYGLSLASGGKRLREAVRLCETAIANEFYRPDLHLNLGRVLLIAGKRARARKAFLKGQELDPQNPEIRTAIAEMGMRKSPVFPFLGRQNPINKWAGWLRHRVLPKSATSPTL